MTAVSVFQRLGEFLSRHEQAILRRWTEGRASDAAAFSSAQDERQGRDLFSAIVQASTVSSVATVEGPAWHDVRRLLEEFSVQGARRGLSPGQTARYVFSFKEPIFELLRTREDADSASTAEDVWATSLLFDSLGLFTMETYQRAREEIISRQREELLELSTPVVQLWDKIIALPLIGTLDSARTQVVMESLLQKIVDTGSEVAIIDITGVPTVDTLVAQHLLKTVAAARLMGAECVLSGIRPQIAQTIVHLGVDLSGVHTKASLADAFRKALALTRPDSTAETSLYGKL
ncbi:STAS domain-containing protein [Achromobacter sp. GG226]|uniref:STAS domain-containing protein n=1 Tax=Verticiella alkaliphila TaxID=2779529 RepID=UPI001C0D6A9F|nr:STAS domain-containing protein [Verticiella sp. GG226]MBU4610870.1 STAS domain-containing protein [Verticiella sp. GG226]